MTTALRHKGNATSHRGGAILAVIHKMLPLAGAAEERGIMTSSGHVGRILLTSVAAPTR
jgi:hypothetical protein